MKSTFRITQRTTLLAILVIALFGSSSFAHTYLSSVILNGVALNEGDCVRPHPDQEKEYPIPTVTSEHMRCGWLPAANNPANRKCPIAAGSTIGVQWHHNSISASDDILEATHKGPIQYFLAKSESGAGDVWFKIYEDGYTGGKWATDKMIENKGKMEVTIPADIAPGNYILRGEILALHNAYVPDGIQPYVGCIELTISGSGSATPSGVSFPGFYTNTGPGMIFDVYSSYSSYTIPGPALYKSGSSSSSSSSTTSSPTTRPTSAPTTRPSSTTSPSTSTPTSTPTYTPTNAPSPGNVKLQMNGGSNEYWVGVIVQAGGSETVVKVEILGSGQSWTTLVDLSYAFIYDGTRLNLPLSVRVTSSSGKTITATNIFASFSTDVIDTGKTFSSSPTTPTNPPTSSPTTRPPSTSTSRPTSPPTSTSSPTTKPTYTPSSPTATPTGSMKITQLSGVSQWWFAVSVSGNSRSITKVELKDSNTLSSYVPMNSNSWGWAYPTQGSPLVTPLTLRLTSETGKTITTTINSIDSGSIFSSNDSL